MEEDLVAQLLASTALAALVSNRINWNTRPQAGALPAVVLHLISAPSDYTYDGRQGLRGSLIQIDCWGGTFTVAKAVARAVEVALDGLVAPIKGAFIINRRDTFEQGAGPQTTGSVNFHNCSIDARVWTAET